MKNVKNRPIWRVFEKQACGQTVFPDKSVIIGQKLVENAKIQSNATFCVIFKQCDEIREKLNPDCYFFVGQATSYGGSAGPTIKSQN